MSENIKLDAWKAAEEIVNLRSENAALRELTSTLGAPNHINIPVEKWRELREDKERLNWLLTYEGGSWIYWAIENGEWTPEVAASRAAIDSARKEAQP